jgi:SAM-dependent methyltransferase
MPPQPSGLICAVVLRFDACMQQAKQATVEFALHWQSAVANHSERLYYERVNFWRDFFPGTFGEQLAALPAGSAASQSFAPGELLPAYNLAAVHRVRPEQINIKMRSGMAITPRAGRFYPRGMVAGLPDVFAGDMRPLRFLGAADGSTRVDLNHPLAPYTLQIEGRIVQTLGVSSERGGRSHDVVDELTRNGPGMQAPHPAVPTDFSSDDAFARLDEREDKLFYYQPRLVQHLDAQVRAQITGLYARFLTPGMRVLDLMSSWVSHLPDQPDLDVTGLGLNAEELKQNRRLRERVMHDLNLTPELPFPDAHFDAVLCTASIEYLTKPDAVFRAVRRVLKPGAPFVVTFSERWFPPKAIQIWSMLHPFERLGLVLDCFRRSGGFTGLGTESARDWPRPHDDQYAGRFAFADPLYAAWGRAG